jgi:hypothetical protein
VRRLVARLGHASTVLEQTPGELLSIFAVEERAYYELVDGRTALRPLCGKGPGEAGENARILYAFFCLGLLQKSASVPPVGKKIRYTTGGGSMR